MITFADEVARDIRSEGAFWTDLAELRAVGIRSTLRSASESVAITGPKLGDHTLARLLSSASVFAKAKDESSRDLAQQIAVFASLASSEDAVHQGAVHILSDLGNFPGLTKLEAGETSVLGFQTYMRRALLKELNSVEMAGKKVSLTEFQLDVWNSLKSSVATAISAPTSAGKSYVVLEHLCESVIAAERFTALYIAPTRALLTEIQGKLERRLSEFASTLRITTIPVLDPTDRPKQIYVLTQERAQLLLSSVDIADAIDLIVVDEAQAMGDDSRGMILQDALEKVKDSNPMARFLFLAPGASGFQLIGDSVGLLNLDVRETSLSPVVQNRISVRFPLENEHLIELNLVTPKKLEPIGSYIFKRGFALNEDGKLAAVAEELGSSGRSLVYATGAKNAEDLSGLIAFNRPTKDSKALSDLAKFIEQHIHSKYSLAHFVRKGVAFHYGNMPSLLREGIETTFRDGQLDYLCCTTTLFQGVNLPARNVFIDTPTRGNKGEALDEASLWNFAGRAGRLGEEVVGNVFLVNYENWDTQPLTERKPFAMKVAFKDTIEADFDAVIKVLDSASHDAQDDERRPADERVTAAAGLVLFRSAQGSLDTLLGRPNIVLTSEQKTSLSNSATHARVALGLPESVLTSSWMLDPVALASLLQRLRHGVKKGEFSILLPVNPSSDSYLVYNSIIRRLYKHLGGFNLSGEEGRRTRGYVSHVTVTALKWMRGEPLTQLVKEAVKFQLGKATKSSKNNPDQAVIDTAIRNMFILVEQTVRFKLVQWAKAYVDLLRFVLAEAGRNDLVPLVYDFSLALELGVSTTTGRSLVEFGLSRITASAIAALITDSSLTPDQVREWIRSQPEPLLLQLSAVVVAELRAKNLLEPEMGDGEVDVEQPV
nr:DEAD/DEAH box helicase [Pseudomonas carnis]